MGLPKINAPETEAENTKSRRRVMMPATPGTLPKNRSALSMKRETKKMYIPSPIAKKNPEEISFFIVFIINELVKIIFVILAKAGIQPDIYNFYTRFRSKSRMTFFLFDYILL